MPAPRRPKPPTDAAAAGGAPERSAPERIAPERIAPERIAKVLARAGLASRRDAEEMVRAGRVAVNGRRLDSPALTVTPADRITVDGQPLPEPERARLWLYHKPPGLVSTARDEQGRATVLDNLPPDLPRVMTVGRLDLNSEGLLLLTNDGALKRRLELPSTGWMRKYRVRVHGAPTAAQLAPLQAGITVEGERFQPMIVSIDRQQGANAWLTVGLREGKNREVRRAMESVGLVVNRLIRISYGPFQLGDLAPGAVEEVRARVLRDQLGEAGTAEAPRAAAGAAGGRTRAPRAAAGAGAEGQGGGTARAPRPAAGATRSRAPAPAAPAAPGRARGAKPAEGPARPPRPEPTGGGSRARPAATGGTPPRTQRASHGVSRAPEAEAPREAPRPAGGTGRRAAPAAPAPKTAPLTAPPTAEPKRPRSWGAKSHGGGRAAAAPTAAARGAGGGGAGSAPASPARPRSWGQRSHQGGAPAPGASAGTKPKAPRTPPRTPTRPKR